MQYFMKNLVVSPVCIMLFVTLAMFAVNLFVLQESWGWGHDMYALGVVSFVVSYFFTYVFFRTAGFMKYRTSPSEPYAIVVKVYWLLSIVGLVLSLYKIYKFGVMGGYDSILLSLRVANTWEGQPSYGAQHFSLFALCLALYYTQEKRPYLCFVASVIYLISALSMAERTTILFLFVAVAYMAVNVGWIRLKGLLVFLSLLVALLVGVAIGTGKTGGENGYDFIFTYFGYAVTALSQWVEGKESQGCASLVYGKLATILSFGFYSCVDLDLGFGERDFNVLTYVSAPYLYGGLPAVLLSMAGCGVFFSLLRVFATRRSGYFLALLSCYMYALVIMFYAWQFSLTTYIYLAVILYPIFSGKFLSGLRRIEASNAVA